jgi:sugar lactone lactonase YvrE
LSADELDARGTGHPPGATAAAWYYLAHRKKEIYVMNVRFVTFVAACATLAAACTPEPEPTVAPEPAATPPPPPAAAAPAAGATIPALITAERGGFIPEGIEYDQTNERFLTGSLAEGSIFTIGLDGSVTPLITDAELVSSVGIEVDEARDRLYATNSDRGVFGGNATGHAKLGIYNLTTGAKVAMVDLAAVLTSPTGSFFANDVAVDDDGNAYVTDTMQNVVYRVDTSNQASVLHRFEPMSQLNGIVYHDGGYLLVAAGARLFKLPIDNPSGTTEVMVAEPVPGSDGMVWASDGRLVITSNVADNPRLVALTSNDDWATAQVTGVARMTGQVTTAAAVGDDVYAVHPHFADADPPSIERGTFQ